MPRAPGRQTGEEGCAFIRQHHMARRARLALSDADRPRIGVEVGNFQPRQLAITAARLQRRAEQRAEVRIGSIDEACRFRHRQIAHPRDRHRTERLELASPGVSHADVPFVKGVVQRRFQHREHPVGGGAPPPDVFVGGWPLSKLRLTPLRARLRRGGGQRCQPDCYYYPYEYNPYEEQPAVGQYCVTPPTDLCAFEPRLRRHELRL